MLLIGMLDSPYVRRTAISMQLLGLRFEHQSISVFRGFDTFQKINPVVKAPSLVCDDGTVLMDSNLIIDYAEALAAPRALLPKAIGARQQALRVVGLALAACEKSIQFVYEHELRPADKRHAPWVDRVARQMHAACDALEGELARAPLPVARETIDQAGVTTAVAWHFMHQMAPELLAPSDYPRLRALSAAAEKLPEFAAAPHGDGVYRAPA